MICLRMLSPSMCCGSVPWRWPCVSWPRSTRPGEPREPHPRRRCAMSEAALQAIDVCKSFRQGPETLKVLAGASLHIAAGERLAIVGTSGSGKTTLLQILGGLDKPSSGRVLVAGRDIHQMGEKERGLLRNQSLGFVYQFHHLLPEFSALENVAMPLLVRRTAVSQAHQASREILERVGLGQRLSHRPYQ